MSSKERFLIISSSSFISGAELSLLNLLTRGFKNFKPILILPQNSQCKVFINQIEQIYYVPLRWFCFTFNPIKLIQFAYGLIISSYYLLKIIKKHNINYIYSNTVKAHVYAVFLNIFIKTKIIWHVRDNIKSGLIYKWLINRTDYVISVSEFIHNQIPLPDSKKRLVYSGIDVNYWVPNKTIFEPSESENRPIIIAQIGQITRWKKHTDFIKAASLIIQSFDNVKFYIIGEDLSGRENKYRKELDVLVNEHNINCFILFLGHREDIKELISQIDILAHPAIDELFGRVIMEAMAMEKPVVAYDCGGPKEIIISNKTGYLVKPFDYKSFAEKIILLLKDENLQRDFGKAGRQRVIEKFNIIEQISKMEALFNSM